MRKALRMPRPRSRDIKFTRNQSGALSILRHSSNAENFRVVVPAGIFGSALAVRFRLNGGIYVGEMNAPPPFPPLPFHSPHRSVRLSPMIQTANNDAGFSRKGTTILPGNEKKCEDVPMFARSLIHHYDSVEICPGNALSQNICRRLNYRCFQHTATERANKRMKHTALSVKEGSENATKKE